MKKILLFVFVSILSISAFAAYENPNPYAYDLSVSAVDYENFKVTLQYSLNAPATSVKIFCQDEEGNSYLLKQFGNRDARTYTVEIDLFDAMENKDVPPGEDLSWSVEVACASRGNVTAVPCGRKINFQSPFSIDIDNNPKSPYFGRILTTQANSNVTRGLRAFNPNFTQIGSNYIGSNVKFPSGNYFFDTHLTPFRIRVLQDGTGKIFVSSADVGQSTYMWKVDPAKLNDWTEFLASDHMINLLGHPDKRDNMGNLNFDFRKNPNGTWDMLLLSTSLDDDVNNCSAGYSHSGIYHLDSDLNTQSYTRYTTNIQGSPDVNVDDKFVASVINANAQFDRDGGVWYSTFSNVEGLKNKSALIHRNTSGQFYDGYGDAIGDRLKRQNTATGAIRYNKDFTKFAVANGGLGDEVTIITMNHDNDLPHPTFSTTTTVNMITETRSNTAYIIDFAWDHANNLYAAVRNGDEADLRGVWVIAWNLNGEYVKTPARDNFSIPCDPEKSFTVTCQKTQGGSIVDGFSGGKQKACTQMTVKAEPVDNNYKFDKWTDQSGKTVSTNAEYTFRVVKDVQLTAHFSGAVFNVTWWNLFQKGEDIAKESTNLSGTNERLWRLVQIEYNHYIRDILKVGYQRSPEIGTIGIKNNQWLVYAFFMKGNSTSEKDYATLLGYEENFFDDATLNSTCYWLGQYIEGLPTFKDIQNGTSTDMWAYHLQAFINRTDNFTNYEGASAGTTINGYTAKNFSRYGHPDYWRPKWTKSICGLNETMNFADNMPITWNQNPCASGVIQAWTKDWKLYTLVNNPADEWYQWNTGGANQLLAWREGSTNGRIVHQVDRDMALYATYVNKHISESQDNYDVIRLMQNSKYASNPHTVTVDRKLQAGMYNTICFPFPLNVTTLPTGHRLKDAEVLKFTGIEELYDESGEVVGVLQFERVTQLEAGKPYLIKVNGQDNITEEMRFEKVAHNNLTYVGGTQSAELSGGGGLITFHAMISPEDIPAGSIILVSDNRLAKVTTQGQMLGLRGYFTIDDPYVQSLADEGKLYLSIKKPTTTSIPVAPEAEQQKAPKVRKIMQDGHIYIIRGEEVYTVTGHRVK